MKERNKTKQDLVKEMLDMHQQLNKLQDDLLRHQESEKILHGKLDNLGKIFDQTINALALAIQMRDPYTAIHQQRVTELACVIAQQLNFSADKIKGINVAATLHDIGKISIPLDILNKPGKLTELEYNLIKEHARVGYNILKEVRFPWPVAQIVLQHHERIDGSGYPAGLRCSDILEEAKIIAVADIVEAMASHRPYRSAPGLDLALNQISSKSGILFDPDVVDACLKIFTEKSFHFV